MHIKDNNTDHKSNVSMNPLCKTIWDVFDAHNILDKKIIVAVSGGSDSMVVLWLLNAYYSAHHKNLKSIVVAHYHHHIREEADRDEELVRRYAKENTYVVASRNG